MLRVRRSPSRTVYSLDGVWSFALDSGEGLSQRWFAGALPDSRPMPVPSSYNDVTTDVAVRNHVGVAWYQRQVEVPRLLEGERLILRFAAATHRATVWVDEHEVMSHEGGYLPFEADITEQVHGSSFRLSVAVDNRLSWQTIPVGFVVQDGLGNDQQQYYHDFFNYAGLHRSVELYTRPATAVHDVTITTDINGNQGLVGYRVEAPGAAQISVRVLDAKGVEVAVAHGAEGEVSVPDAHLWAPAHGYLYTLEVHADDDVYPQPFGIRTVEVRGHEFLINGKPFYFRGYGRHEDNLVRGKGHDNVMMVHDFELMAWQGANSFRTTHYPYAEEIMDFADQQGVVVIDETAAVGMNTGVSGGILSIVTTDDTYGPDTVNDETQRNHESHIRELIARDKNHPCVVMWSISNEPDSHSDAARDYFEPLVAATREADPTRPVAYANVYSGVENDKITDLFDVIMLNRYYGWYSELNNLPAAEPRLRAELDQWLEKVPNKPIMFTEYGTDTMGGMRDVKELPWSEDYQAAYYALYHRVFDDYPQVIGEQVWNFADFQTGQGITRVDGNRKGVFTRDRRPKAAAFELRERWLEMRTRQGW